ncbi:hypothetical protein BH23CHL2_BH23CHL2_06620 [soil metagenome]
MDRKRQPERDDEPAVTFELEEAPRRRTRGRFGVAGGAAVAGAGLISSGASPDSIDVFDHPDEPGDQQPGVPVTSFLELGADEVDREFPPIDFAAPVAADTADAETAFGASADIGGGFALDDAGGETAFGASEGEVEAIPDSLVDDRGISVSVEDEPDLDSDLGDDLDLS